MFEGTNIIDFTQKFRTDKDCLKYLARIKWRAGFCCPKCRNDNYCKGRKEFVRRCTRCKYEESVTSGTIFHKLKFPMLKAFYMVFFISTSKKGISSGELSRRVSLRQPTCWLFKRKVMHGMQQYSKGCLLNGLVQIDEFVIGGPEKLKRGRSHGKKKLVVAAIEYGKDGIHKVVARTIENSGTKQLKPFVQDNISVLSKIKTDKWRGYTPIKKLYNLKQVNSKTGKGLPEIHRYIMTLKGWLRGIHHHCSIQHIQAYLDEFNFRLNNSNRMKTIFYRVQKLMMCNKPITHKLLSVS